MSLNIIGISSHFHDASCCLLQGGLLTAAAEEERFSRAKHDPRLPIRAFQYCLREGGIEISEIDCVAYYEDPVKKAARQLWMSAVGSKASSDVLLGIDPNRVEREIRETLGYEGPVFFGDHHQSHAASCYFFSGFHDAAVLTVDGVGEWATTTYGHGQGADLRIFEEVNFPDSLGLLYSTITAYLGFDVNDGEYKVMGLAPYGEPRYGDRIRALLRTTEGGQYQLNLEYFDFLNFRKMYSDTLISLLGHPPRIPETEILPFHKDVARSLQFVLEEILLEKLCYLHARIPSENLCMAGGVALNCVANGRLLRDGPFKRLFVQPAASDSGACLGAAVLAHLRLAGQPIPNRRLEHVYLGPAFSNSDICRLLEAAEVQAVDFRDREPELLDTTARMLAAGEVVGWFHGRMEFGPRALGARSILADPRRPEMRERINQLVKKRESFRPFAPAVLEEAVSLHFDLDHPSPFMLETCRVKSGLSLPSITHVDGSARVQTVNSGTSPRFASLIQAFERLTGCPMLLNTSFNLRGEPIVCTPTDALQCFAKSGIDCLILEDFMLNRHALPERWPELARQLQGKGIPAITHSVYTLV